MMRWSVVALTAALVVTGPGVATAQADPCSIAGEYVLSASLVSHPGPGQLTGTLVFTAPLVCGPAGEGTATLDIQLVTPGGVPVFYRGQLRYTVEGTTVLVDGGALRAELPEHSVDETSLVVSGGPGIVISGSLLRRPSEIGHRR